ncbi:MAG: methyltransferase domain-containing protein [Hyphomicrobiales bacterium]|nr:MAG: methyltransferase domain-containing protein [Hyphomicrobiales bacterium]
MHWRDRLLDFAVGRIRNARFRASAARNPLLRPIARANAAALFDLCAGFAYTQTLLAVVELELLPFVDERPRTLSEIARHAGLAADSAEMLLRSACALGLLRRRGDRTYGLGLRGAALIENPGVVAMIAHNALLYRDLADPVDVLRKSSPDGELASFWGYGMRHAEPATGADAQSYSQLMAVSQQMIAEEVLASVTLGDCRRLLDIGGGLGVFGLAVKARAPAIDVTVLDLPEVADAATRFIRSQGVAGITAVGCNFVRDPLPTGADVISLVRVLHDHDDAVVRHLLEAAAGALRPGGMLMIAEPMRGPGAAARMADAYFGFYLRAMGRGRARSAEELSALMRDAGFTDVHQKATRIPLLVSVLVGKCSK